MKQNQGYLKFVLPSYLFFLTLTLMPILGTIGLSFIRFDLANPFSSLFIGVENYSDLISDARFHNSLKVMFILLIFPVVVQMIMGSALAIALNERIRGTNWMRIMFLAPAVIPPIAVGLIWKVFLVPKVGGLAWMIRFIHMGEGNIEWLGAPNLALSAIIIASIWVGTPFVTLMTLAALETIPEALNEAASIDGASWLKRLRHITLPTILPTSQTIALFRVLEVLGIFPIIFILTGGGPASATEPINYYAYVTGFKYLRLGYASSIIIVFFFFIFIICIPLLRKVINR